MGDAQFHACVFCFQEQDARGRDRLRSPSPVRAAMPELTIRIGARTDRLEPPARRSRRSRDLDPPLSSLLRPSKVETLECLIDAADQKVVKRFIGDMRMAARDDDDEENDRRWLENRMTHVFDHVRSKRLDGFDEDEDTIFRLYIRECLRNEQARRGLSPTASNAWVETLESLVPAEEKQILRRMVCINAYDDGTSFSDDEEEFEERVNSLFDDVQFNRMAEALRGGRRPPEEKTVYTDTLVILFIKELLQELGCGDSSSAQGPTSWLSVPQSDERRLQAHALSLSLSGLCPCP